MKAKVENGSGRAWWSLVMAGVLAGGAVLVSHSNASAALAPDRQAAQTAANSDVRFFPAALTGAVVKVAAQAAWAWYQDRMYYDDSVKLPAGTLGPSSSVGRQSSMLD